MKYIQTLSEKGKLEWQDSDAPDANGRFKDLSPKDLAAWLIKTRKGDMKKISGSLSQQVAFNKNDDPEYAKKMDKTRKEVYKQLDREDLLESVLNESVDMYYLDNAKEQLSNPHTILDITYDKTTRGDKFVRFDYENKYVPGKMLDSDPHFVKVFYDNTRDLKKISKELNMDLKESVLNEAVKYIDTNKTVDGNKLVKFWKPKSRDKWIEVNKDKVISVPNSTVIVTDQGREVGTSRGPYYLIIKESVLNEEDTWNDYPAAAKKNAQKAIDWKEEHGRDEVDAGTPVGWARAHQLAKGENLSTDTVKRMSAFNRHRKNSSIKPELKETPWKDRGYVAWLIWGGDEGVDWAIEKSKEIDAMKESKQLKYVKPLNEAENYITDEFKVGDKIKTGFGEWEVIETDYAPNKSFTAPFIFKGKDMKRVNIPNPPKTNKNAVGYKVTDGDKYPIIGFLYQYKDITKLATVGVDESVVTEGKIKYSKGKTYQSSGHWTVYVDSNSSGFDIRVNHSAGWRLDPHDEKEETLELLDNGRQRATIYFKSGNIDKLAQEMFDLNDRTSSGNQTKLTAKDYADIIRVWIDMKMANESIVNEWGSSDQNIFNKSMHKEMGSPRKMPSPFDDKLRGVAADNVDHYWDDWEEYDTDRDGLIDNAVRGYLRSFFKKDFEMMQKMFASNNITEGKSYQEKFRDEASAYQEMINDPSKRVYDIVDFAQFTTGGMTEKQWEMFMYGRYKKNLQSKDSKTKEKMYKVLTKWLSESSVTEASRRKVHKAAKQGSYPAVIVVVQDGKVIHQEPVSTPDIAPATFNVMQEKYPKAVLHLEDNTGKRLFTENMKRLKSFDNFVAEKKSIITEAKAYKLKASEFGGDTHSAAYNVKGETTWRVHSTYAIDQVSGENNPEERDVVFFEAMPINNDIYIKIGGINNLKRSNGATVGNNFSTTIDEWKIDSNGIAKEASDFLTDATHLKWINKKARSEGQAIKWALKDDYSSVIEDLVNKSLGLSESVVNEDFPGKGETVKAKDLNHEMLDYFNRMNISLSINTKSKKNIKGSVGTMFNDLVFNGGDIDKNDIVSVKIIESVVTEKREDVGKYNTVKKVIAKIGRRPSEQELATFITKNYYDVTEVERGDDDPAANDKIADLVGFYKFDIDDWNIAWFDAQNESVKTFKYIKPLNEYYGKREHDDFEKEFGKIKYPKWIKVKMKELVDGQFIDKLYAKPYNYMSLWLNQMGKRKFNTDDRKKELGEVGYKLTDRYWHDLTGHNAFKLEAAEAAMEVSKHIQDMVANKEEVEPSYYLMKNYFNTFGMQTDRSRIFNMAVEILDEWMSANAIETL